MAKAKPALPDKRSRSDLDWFILVCIDSGIETAYQLQMVAGLSQGASVPALRRLERLGYITSNSSGMRPKVTFSVTDSGRAHLPSWNSLLDSPVPPDVDAVLRIAVLAILLDAPSSRVRSYLSRVSRDRAERSQQHLAEARSAEEVSGPAKYVWARAWLKSKRLEAESKALKLLARKLG